MKNLIASLLIAASAGTLSAQQTQGTSTVSSQPNKPNPEMLATRHSKHLTKMLGLNTDQEQKVYQAILTRITSVQSIKAKYGQGGDKKAERQEIKPVREQYVQTMDGILTPDQKTKWDAHRTEIKQQRAKKNTINPAPPVDAGNGTPAKLTGEDDGIDD